MGKILECGAAAAQPRHGTNGLLGLIDHDCFIVEPASADQICSIDSVAAHTLYERSNPLESKWPGGLLDLSGTVFEQHDARSVRITGSAYTPAADYFVKLEGAARVGYRTITIAGTRDPSLIQEFPTYVANVRERVTRVVSPLLEGQDFTIAFHVYGRDGVMGVMEPIATPQSHELGLVIEVIGRTEAISRQVLATTRSVALHSTYPRRKAIAGNLAFPFSPSDIGVGDAFEFNIYHLVRLDHPCELFPIQYIDQSETLAEVFTARV
jgi:hypothetical protein